MVASKATQKADCWVARMAVPRGASTAEQMVVRKDDYWVVKTAECSAAPKDDNWVGWTAALLVGW